MNPVVTIPSNPLRIAMPIEAIRDIAILNEKSDRSYEPMYAVFTIV